MIPDMDYGKGPVGSFLKKLDIEKQVVGNMYKNVKRDIPTNASGGLLVREFRVDEEYGMSHAMDPGLERKGGGQLDLVDRVAQIQREKMRALMNNQDPDGFLLSGVLSTDIDEKQN